MRREGEGKEKGRRREGEGRRREGEGKEKGRRRERVTYLRPAR